jgi:hypothetical protein
MVYTSPGEGVGPAFDAALILIDAAIVIVEEADRPDPVVDLACIEAARLRTHTTT